MPFASVGYYFPSYLGGLSLRQTWLMWSLRKWRFLRLQAETFIEAIVRSLGMSKLPHFPAFGWGLSLRSERDLRDSQDVQDFPAFGWGPSLRCTNPFDVADHLCKFLRFRAGTFIEASSRTATSEAPRMISLFSCGDFH